MLEGTSLLHQGQRKLLGGRGSIKVKGVKVSQGRRGQLCPDFQAEMAWHGAFYFGGWSSQALRDRRLERGRQLQNEKREQVDGTRLRI